MAAHAALRARMSAQLAVLAAAAVDPTVDLARFPPGLTRNACTHAGQGLAARRGDRLAAFVAELRAFAGGHVGPRGEHRVLHRVVDLVLHRAVARPASGHFAILSIGEHGKRAPVSSLAGHSAAYG